MTWFIEYSTSAKDDSVRLELGEGKPLRIGRGSASDTKIADSSLSRIHCELELVSGAPVLRDVGSTTGTMVGGRKIDELELKSGQSFVAGQTKFLVVSDSPLDAPTTPRQKSGAPNSMASLMKRFEERPKLDRFDIKKLINRDGKSLVYKGIDCESGDDVAIKVIPTAAGNDEDEARFMRAMKMLQELRDPYLVKLVRAARKKTYCWVAMEWMPEGSVADRMEKQGIGGCLDWRVVWKIANSISQSLYVLEQNGIVHRNIRPTNILCRSSNGTWVLSDLVVARTELASGKLVTQQVFLPTNVAYTAPERLLGREDNHHSLQADIYSLGAVLTEALTGEPPYGRGDLVQIRERIPHPRKLVSRESQIGLNELFVDFVNKLTEPDPAKRIQSGVELWRQAERVGQLSGMSSL